MAPPRPTSEVVDSDLTLRQEIVDRMKEFFQEKGWKTMTRIAKEMGVRRNSIYALYDLTTDPQYYYNRLGEAGCDLNWLRTGERITGASPAFLSKEQARAQGLPEEIGNYTLEDLRRAFAPHLSIEEAVALANEIAVKARKDGHSDFLAKKKQPKKKAAKTTARK